MPHLSQLQRDYKDKQLTIIGVTSADSRGNTLEAVRAMVEEKGEGMDYAVAFDEGRTTNEAWMEAADQQGIPASFLVDKTGGIAWIGHPAEADIPIAMVIDGTWDPKEGPALMARIGKAKGAIYAAMREPKRALELYEQFKAEYPLAAKGTESLHFEILSRLPDQVEAATRVGTLVVDRAIAAKNAMELNIFAWGLVDPQEQRENRFLDLALRAANKASELTHEQDGAILDTVARVHFWRGDLARAAEIQARAVEHAEGEMKAALEEVLAEYEQALAKQRES